MPAPSRSQTPQSERTPSLRESGDPDGDPRAELARAVPRRASVSWWLAIVLAFGFAALVAPAITAERWPLQLRAGTITAKQPAPFTVRAPMLAGGGDLRVRGGVVVARGETASRDEAAIADAIADAMPRGPVLYLALFALTWVLAALFTSHLRRSNRGRLVRVQIVSLSAIAAVAIATKLVLLSTAVSTLVVPIAALAIVPTMALDRDVGLATGVLGALVVSLLAPFDLGLAILLLVQAASAGLVIAERPRRRWRAALAAGLVATLCTSATYLLLTYLTTGGAPDLRDPMHSAWLAAAIGPAVGAVVAVPLLPLYQRLVGEITHGKLVALEDLGHPLLRQIAERAPGTWQHSLMMANMAELAANAIGASGRLVRVGAYFHDLGKSLQPKYFIENLEPGETSPHDRLPPEVSCDAIFAHVTEGIAAARKARLHERIVDFMHMHHGNGVLEYFWGKCQEQGNPQGFTIERFRYPGHPPQSRETAILAICDAVEAASRTLHKPDAAAIDALVQRIVYGKLHLGQLDESGLSMGDLRRINDSLRETIRHANHGRIADPCTQPIPVAVPRTATPPSAHPRPPARHPTGDPTRAAGPPSSDGHDPASATRPPASDSTRTAGPPVRESLENATTNPPPRRRAPSGSPAVATDPAQVAAALAAIVSRVSGAPFGLQRGPDSRLATTPPATGPASAATSDFDSRVTDQRRAVAAADIVTDGDAGTTEPSMPMLDIGDARSIDLPAAPPPGGPARPWSSGLAARVDAVLVDEWGNETPVVSPTSAELRVVFGHPDPTRQVPVDEIELLQRRAAELGEPETRRRTPPPTAEVDPDDIEAAIEVAPPARRPVARNTIGVHRPKKSE